ncbi:hypothetical protein P7C70_g5658, partial [Phenoliferia sp. Uapishka_3]
MAEPLYQTPFVSFPLHPAFLPPPVSVLSSPRPPFILALLPYLPSVFLLVTLAISSIAYIATLLPTNSRRLASLHSLFQPFITPADILSTPGITPLAPERETKKRAPGVALRALGALEFVGRSAVALKVVLETRSGGDVGWGTVWRETVQNSGIHMPIIMTLTWLAALSLEVYSPSISPPFRHLTLFSLLLTDACVNIILSIHNADVVNWTDLARVPDAIICAVLVGVIVSMPLGSGVGIELGVEKDGRPQSPEDANTLLGSLTYSWMGSLMSLAYKRPLKSNDVWALVAVTLGYLRPYFIQRILETLSLPSNSTSLFSEDWSPHSTAYIYALFAFLSMSGQSLAQLQHFHHARRIGMRLRSELTIEVFEKVLRRKDMAGRIDGGGGEGEASAGKVVSLVSEDTDRVLRMGCDSHLIYGAPLEITLALLFLYNLMGWSAFVGFSILAITVPSDLGKRSIEITRGRAAARDDRQSSLQEMIAAIRTIKFFGWTEAWVEKTEEKRAIELKWMVKEWINSIYLTLLWSLISVVVPLSAFWCYVKVQKEELTVAVAFTALALFTIIPDFGIRILQTQVSIKRMESFLAEEEVASHAELDHRTQAGDTLAFRKATLEWHETPGSDSKPFCVKNLNIEFPKGGLTLICGPTGAGKTSLLLGLLGELKVVAGSVVLPKRVSYAAQHPWLESCSIRDNILFGYGYSHERYSAVLEGCALRPDLATLPAGDLTHVGERGVSLSGGQKARIALARALYAPTTHVLLDDVFSAVDSHTAKRLFQTLQGPMLVGRTCVLVTHHVDLVVSGAAYRVNLLGGNVVFQGRPETARSFPANKGTSTVTPNSEEEAKVVDPDVDEPSQVVEAEGWTTGEVKRSIYTTYLKASNYSLWEVLLLLMLGRPAFAFLEQYWLRLWGEASLNGRDVNSTFFLAVYAAIGLSSTALLVGSTLVLYIASYRASRSIFSKLVLRVVHAPSRWFDVVPLGRVTARFTRDVSTLDGAIASKLAYFSNLDSYSTNLSSLAVNFSNFANHLLSMTSSLLITVVILPATIIPTACFAFIYTTLFTRYLAVNRDVNRIGATTASPLFSTFHQVLVGITTIRAFAKERDYRAELCSIVDETLALWYCTCTLDVWLSIRTQLLSSCCLLATASFAIYAGVSPGLAGIAITSSQSIIQSLDWLCSAYGKLVLGLNSLERITEYLDLPQEPSEGRLPPANWPSASASALITVEDLEIKYSPELPAVLKGISFSIKPGERVAVAGRTGSGKSTLAMSLLRFVDPSKGSIVIDGLDVTKISLEELRRRITFLPQEAMLFSGVLRDNLDPLHVHTDEECLDALRRVHLLSESFPSSSGAATPIPMSESDDVSKRVKRIHLHTKVSGGGNNFSSGQRQLIALARALLRDSRIIVMDESTAAVDFALDKQIQETVRAEFSNAALITIAHRLATIVDYDRVMVLNDGQLCEFDTPARLLATESAFHQMCRESGDYEDLLARVRGS